MAKILKCEECGSIIQVLAIGDENACNDHMLAIPVQTEGEKSPKHKPVVEIDGDKVTVKVGEAAHPMDDDHYIQFLIVEAGDEQYAKCFKPGDVAEATFTVNDASDVKACAFCNLHGLWASE
ncbi:desulfoferrodoxin family protein [Methanobrevibacter sp.]|uniref:desulfoferrodoxin family protein n=1 Tax=Methanobrevibacter sp. TaxID=66852 RepID=UPI0025CFF174|nr:desulfoferrodoxin family protein [Methanobrevibacter sp.]